MRRESVIKFHKPLRIQLYGYLALIPFFFAFLALKESYTVVKALIFVSGALFILSLLLINHLEPVLRVTSDKILLYNTFNNRPVILLKKDFSDYRQINKKFVLITFNNKSYEVKLNKKEMEQFINILKELN